MLTLMMPVWPQYLLPATNFPQGETLRALYRNPTHGLKSRGHLPLCCLN